MLPGPGVRLPLAQTVSVAEVALKSRMKYRSSICRCAHAGDASSRKASPSHFFIVIPPKPSAQHGGGVTRRAAGGVRGLLLLRPHLHHETTEAGTDHGGPGIPLVFHQVRLRTLEEHSGVVLEREELHARCESGIKNL